MDAMIKRLRGMNLNVMPLKPKSKHPISSWKHLTTQKYMGPFPQMCNIGVICGKISGNLFVVDLDDSDLYKEFSDFKTFTVRTGRGFHLYFRSKNLPPARQFNRGSQHIDVKSEGGYVLAPDSLHPETGKAYVVERDAPIMDIDPAKIRDRLLSLKFQSVQQKQISNISSGVSQGSRDDSMFKYACYLIRDKQLYGAALQKEMDEVNARNKPPLPSADLDRIVQQATKYEGKKIRPSPQVAGGIHQIEMQDINPSFEGKMLEFECMITAVGQRQTYTIKAELTCPDCGKLRTTRHDIYYRTRYPKCPDCKVDMDIQSMETAYIQRLRIQEFLEKARQSSPVEFDAEILDANVGEAFIGDRKLVRAKFRSIPARSGYNAIVFEIRQMDDIEQKVGCMPTDQEIADWKKRPSLMDDVRDSILPEILINPRILETAMLWAAGGSSLNGQRPDIHVAILGDAQLGKSELLTRMHSLLPGSGYTIGRNTTGAGLTIGMVKLHDGTSVPMAGLLPQHTGRHVIIDEGDKMRREDQNSILDCMEQGTSTLTKNGVPGLTLPAKCPILFAGNPKGGKYSDKRASVLDNFDMETPFITRFDVIWLLRDQNSEASDDATRAFIRSASSRKAQMSREELQRYFSYTRTLSPKIPEDIMDMIDGLHKSLRPLNQQDAMPVGWRQYHGIYRLVSACASLRLHDTATLGDFETVRDILTEAMKSMDMDVSTGRANRPVNKSRDTKQNLFFDIFNQCCNSSREADRDEVVAELAKTGMYNRIQAEGMFDSLVRAGTIEMTNSSLYRSV